MDKLMSIKEMAEYIGCSRQTIYNYLKDGMPKIRLSEKGHVRFEREEVLKWIKERQSD